MCGFRRWASLPARKPATELDKNTAATAAMAGAATISAFYRNGDQMAWALRLGWTATGQQGIQRRYVKYGDKRFDGSPDASGCWHDSSAGLCLLMMTEGRRLHRRRATVAQAKVLAGCKLISR